MATATLNHQDSGAPPAATPRVGTADQPGARPAPFTLLTSDTFVYSRSEALAAAQAHQELPRSPTERELEPKRVRELTERLKNGVFLPCCWATVIYNGVKYRMNGMHSSQALLDAQEFLPARVTVHLDHYEAPDREGMAVLFRQFDARFSGRSKKDVAGAYQGLVEEIEHVSRRKAKEGVEGIAWYERNREGLPVRPGDEQYAMFFEVKYHRFLRWLDKVLTIKTPELERTPVIAAMYGTFLTSESGAQEFWAHVAKNDLTDDNDPRAVLSQELVKIREEKGQAQAPPPAEFYAKCIKAWNAFRNGDKVRSLNVNTKKGLPDIAA